MACFTETLKLCTGTRVTDGFVPELSWVLLGAGLSVDDGGCHQVKGRQALKENLCLNSRCSFPEKGEVWRSVYEELILPRLVVS